MQRATLALPLILIAAACGGDQDGLGGRSVRGADERPAEEAPPAVARGCPPAARQGPWTACAEAEWVSRVAEAAGYRVVDETGSALVVEGDDDSFYIWTTRHAIVPPIEEILEEEGWKELGTASRVTIYGDERLWRWWSTDDTIFWIKAGPYENSTVPDVSELERLVAASLRLQSPSEAPMEQGRIDARQLGLGMAWPSRSHQGGTGGSGAAPSTPPASRSPPAWRRGRGRLVSR